MLFSKIGAPMRSLHQRYPSWSAQPNQAFLQLHAAFARSRDHFRYGGGLGCAMPPLVMIWTRKPSGVELLRNQIVAEN